MQHTTNYNLNKFEAADRVTRDGFNQNADRIDAAIKAASDAASRVHFGTYIGDGTANRTISLGYTPQAVAIWNRFGQQYSRSTNTFHGGFCGTNAPCADGSKIICQVVSGGFQVSTDVSRSMYVNNTNETYYYLVLE